MKRWTILGVATLAASVVACDDTDCRNELTWSSSFDGQLVYVESTRSAFHYGRGLDEEQYVEDVVEGPGLEDVPEDQRRVRRSVKRITDTGMSMRWGILSVGLAAATVEMRRPASPGSYSLSELGGRVCERFPFPEENCFAVTGRLDVLEVVAPCGLDGCGRLEATITIDEPESLPQDATVHGKGKLHYRETVDEVCIGSFALLETSRAERGVA